MKHTFQLDSQDNLLRALGHDRSGHDRSTACGGGGGGGAGGGGDGAGGGVVGCASAFVGEVEVAAFKAGKGWKVRPWVFDPGTYNEIKRVNKRFPLHEHDLSMTCTDGTFPKMTFPPEGTDTLSSKYLSAKNEDLQAVGRKIIAEARRCSEGIYRDHFL